MFHQPITGPAVRKLPFVASVRSLWGSVTAAPYETIGLAFDVTCTLQQRSVYRVSDFAAVSATSTCRGPISNPSGLLRRRILFYLFTPPYTPYRYWVPPSEGMATRRSHNKTRLGCKECKRRRIKVSRSYEFLIGPSCIRDWLCLFWCISITLLALRHWGAEDVYLRAMSICIKSK